MVTKKLIGRCVTAKLQIAVVRVKIKRELYSSMSILLKFYDLATNYSVINTYHDTYRITNDRKRWIPLILAHQESLNLDVDVYICDLHFHQKDLEKKETCVRLNAGAIPQLR